MKCLRTISITALLAGVVLLGSCNKKKPNVPPPQAQAPTISQPAPAPEAQPAPPPPVSEEPSRPQPEAQPPAPAEQPAEAAAPKPKPKRSRAAKKAPAPSKSASVQPPPPAPAPPPPPPQLQTAQPSHTVVQQGGAPTQNPPQLSASMSHDAAIHQRMTTAQLQEATEYNLKSISRALNSDEQAMVEHIRSYMQQSRSASADGDMDRAYNLAMKAHLLSDELVKR